MTDCYLQACLTEMLFDLKSPQKGVKLGAENPPWIWKFPN